MERQKNLEIDDLGAVLLRGIIGILYLIHHVGNGEWYVFCSIWIRKWGVLFMSGKQKAVLTLR